MALLVFRTKEIWESYASIKHFHVDQGQQWSSECLC